MAEFELLYHEDQPEDFARISKRYEEFSSSVEEMIDALARMAPGSWGSLKGYFRKFDFYIQFLLAPPTHWTRIRPMCLIWRAEISSASRRATRP